MLRALLLSSMILAAACENTPTEPVQGRFDLVSVNGSSIPTAASFELFRCWFEEVKVRTELHPHNDQGVRYHRQQHAIPSRDRAADDKLVLVTIFEVEMYQ